MFKKIYTGWITEGSNGEESDILFLVSTADLVVNKLINKNIGICTHMPLAEQIQNDITHKYVNIRYFIADKELDPYSVDAEFYKYYLGYFKAEYSMTYSEYTGYLFTEEELEIDGHDLLYELQQCVGKYLVLEISITSELELKNEICELKDKVQSLQWKSFYEANKVKIQAYEEKIAELEAKLKNG